MSEFWDNFGEKASAFLKAAGETAADLGRKGKAAAKKGIEKARDKAAEMRLNSQLKDTFAKLGEAFYEQAVNGADFEEKEELLEAVTSIKQTLSELAEKAAAPEEAAEAEEAPEAEKEPAGEEAPEEEPAGEPEEPAEERTFEDIED